MSRTTANPTRRRFFRQFGTGLAASAAIPAWAESPDQFFPALPSFIDEPDEDYWNLVRAQFAIPKGKIMVNSANLCPPPYFINEKVASFHADLARDVSFQNRAKYGEMKNQALEMLADFVGAHKNECGITRNTSEANNIVVNGLDLGKKDEVIVWDQNHPSINTALSQRSKRRGFTVKQVSVPKNPDTIEDLLNPFVDAINSKTRLICFSHISNVSGIKMPVKELCALANEKGILTHVDGAQGLGFVDLDLHDLGCDFYTASTHKWLMGPFENGLLYVKNGNLDKVWATIISAGWSEENAITTDSKLCMLGQRNVAETATLPDIVDFHKQIGKKNIEKRVLEINTYFRNKLQEDIAGVSFVTPENPEINANITIFNLDGLEGRDVFGKLYSDYGIAGAPTGGIRISPTINSNLEDIDMIVNALTKI